MAEEKAKGWQDTPVGEWTDEHASSYLESDEHKQATEQMHRAADIINAAQTQADNAEAASKKSGGRTKLYDHPRSKKD